MMRSTPGIHKMLRPVSHAARACAVVVTESGMVLKGDTDMRPGDPIIGPDNRVHVVERVLPHKMSPGLVAQLQTLF